VPITFFLHIVHLRHWIALHLTGRFWWGDSVFPLTQAASVIDRFCGITRGRCSSTRSLHCLFLTNSDKDSTDRYCAFLCRLRFLELTWLGRATSSDFRSFPLIGSLFHQPPTPATLENLKFNHSLGDGVALTTSTIIHFVKIYVTLKSGAIWTPLPVIQWFHGYTSWH